MQKKCSQIFDEFLQIIHNNIIGEDRAIVDLMILLLALLRGVSLTSSLYYLV